MTWWTEIGGKTNNHWADITIGTALGLTSDICRKLGVSEQTFYRWKKKFMGLDVSDVRELKQLRDENRKLKSLVAELSLDKTILREALRKKW